VLRALRTTWVRIGINNVVARSWPAGMELADSIRTVKVPSDDIFPNFASLPRAAVIVRLRKWTQATALAAPLTFSSCSGGGGGADSRPRLSLQQ
jgi:hypothetical protein